uniref:ATP synthase B chain n=1 Tax=Schimmelmannia schousboei TaxID=173468 RepID=A0A0E3DB62_9FLOR|nr:ATP synthase B chain precursor [Schimmelmannia schousboei]
MFNFNFSILTILILISQNILLLNEETLILFCFILFCIIAFNKLNKSISLDFSERAHKIENSLIESLNKVLKSLRTHNELQILSNNTVSNFKFLKNHFYILTKMFGKKLPEYKLQKLQFLYTKKLIFTQRLEQQTTKLIALLLSQKLYKLTHIKHFYTHQLKISSFLCFYKISLREYLEII